MSSRWARLAAVVGWAGRNKELSHNNFVHVEKRDLKRWLGGQKKQKTEIQEPLIPFFYPGIPRHVEDLRRGVSMGMPIVQIKAEM